MKQIHPKSQTSQILYQEPTKAEMAPQKPSMGKGAVWICLFIIVAVAVWSVKS